MAIEDLKKLGSGIAKALPDQRLDDTMRIRYVPSEEGEQVFRFLGALFNNRLELDFGETLQIGELGVSTDGSVWRKNENGQTTTVVSSLDLFHTAQAVKNNEKKSTLNEFEDRSTGKRILARILPNPVTRSPKTLEVWIAKTPKDTQLLVDAVFCLHFHQPAADSRGVVLSESQILQEAQRVGITFNMNMEGKPLLPQFPQKR